MDRELSQQFVQHKKKRLWMQITAAVAVLIAVVWGVRSVFFVSIRSSDIRTAVAERGPVENTLTAVGEVQPEFEQLITSPVPAVIQRALLNEGSPVKAGEKILELDKTTPQLDYEKQKDQLELRRNGLVKLRLDLDKSFYDLQISDSIKAFRIEALKAEIENAKRLYKAGGGTRETIEKLENDLHIARLEKKQLENDLRTRQAITKVGIRESEITAAIQEKELRAFQQKLEKADIRATHAGILTYINKNLGQQVQEGEALARVADLSSYKVLASISDHYSARLSVGMPVLIRLDNAQLSGTLVNIHPAVKNNVIHFDVALQAENARNLRPKMKVEVYLVTEQRLNTLRVANGPAFNGAADPDVFVLRPDGVAERRRVKTGLVSFDHVEIIQGVQAGEKVIISDMSRYRHVKEISVD